MSSLGGVIISCKTVGRLLIFKLYANDIIIACFLGVVVNRIFNAGIEVSSHYSQSAEYFCVGVVFTYSFQKFRVSRSKGIHLLLSVAVACIVGAKVYNYAIRGKLCKIPGYIGRSFTVCKGVVAKSQRFVIWRDSLIVNYIFGISRIARNNSVAAY